MVLDSRSTLSPRRVAARARAFKQRSGPVRPPLITSVHSHKTQSSQGCTGPKRQETRWPSERGICAGDALAAAPITTSAIMAHTLAEAGADVAAHEYPPARRIPIRSASTDSHAGAAAGTGLEQGTGPGRASRSPLSHGGSGRRRTGWTTSACRSALKIRLHQPAQARMRP